jgi:hypothetical protein
MPAKKDLGEAWGQDIAALHRKIYRSGSVDAIGSSWNYLATKNVGRIATKHFKQIAVPQTLC